MFWALLSSLLRAETFSDCGVRGCSLVALAGFSVRWLLLRSFSGCGTQTLERELSSCGALAQWPSSTWNLPVGRDEGSNPYTLCCQEEFLPTVPLGTSKSTLFLFHNCLILILFIYSFIGRAGSLLCTGFFFSLVTEHVFWST